jgi:Fe-S-cluster containining protein
MATARLKLATGRSAIDVPVSVPSGAVPAVDVLPAIQRLQNELVAAAEREVAREGRAISCRAGCGACCRQPVPLSDVEAEALLGVIERLPDARRATVRQRLADAEARLEDAGLAAPLRRMGQSGEDSPDVRSLADRYFKLGIACPFLENEACSIYAERPIPCRAYVVTSPAALCSDVLSRDVRTVPVLQLSPALQSMTADPAAPRRRWTVMTLLLERARQPWPAAERQTGPHWIGRLLRAVQTMTAG